MADNIESFSFDASDAISELARLEKGVLSVNDAVSQFNVSAAGTQKVDPFAGARKSLDDYVKQVKTKSKIASDALDGSRSSIDNIGLSWQSVTRLIAGDLIRRAIFEVKDAFFEASDAAAAFQLQIARIDAITEDLGFDQIEQQILELSTALSRPVEEVGEALFEAFQNELGTTAETLEIVGGAANDLALITGGSLTQSVNAISSAVKGYNLGLEEAQGVSSLLFNTIDNGRVTLDELENSLGKVSGLGKAAGVDLENLLAAVSTITVAGTKADVAFTQVRNVLNKAIKPTKELRAALNELGVRTFADLVKRSGNFRNAIEEIFNQLGRDPEKFAKAFNTIRGQLGAINILLEDGKDGASVFNRILAEGAVSSGKLQEGLAGIRETDAFKEIDQAAKFNRILTELGEGALAAKTQVTGLLLTVVDDAPSAAAALAGLTTAVGAYAAVWTGLIAIPFASAFPVALAVAFGAALGLAISDDIDRFRRFLTEIPDEFGLVQRAADNLKLVTREQEQALENLQAQLGDLTDPLLSVSAEGREAFNDLAVAADVAGEKIGSIFSDATTVFADRQKTLLSDVEKAIDDLDKKFKDATSNLVDAQQELEEFDFTRSLENLSEGTKAVRLQERAFQQLSKARRAALSLEEGTGSREELDNAIKLAKEYAKANTQAQRRLGNQFNLNQALDLEREVLSEIVRNSLELRNTINETRGKDLRSDFLEMSEDSAALVSNSKELQQLLSTTGADGQLKTSRQQLDDLEKAKQLQQDFIKEGEAFKGLDIFKDLDLQDQASKSIDGFSRALSTATIDWTKNVEGLQLALNGKQFQANVEFVQNAQDLSEGSRVGGLVDDAVAGVGTPVEAQGAVAAALGETILEQSTLNAEILKGEANFRLLVTQAETLVQGTNNFSLAKLFAGQDAQNAQKTLQGISEQVRTVGSENIRDLEVQLVASLQRLKQLNEDGIISNVRFEQLNLLGQTLFSALAQKAELFANQAKFDPALLQDATKLNEELGKASQVEITPEVDASGANNLNQTIKETAAAGKVAEQNVAAVGPAAQRGVAPASNLASTVGSIGDAATNALGPVDALINRIQQAINLQSQLNSSGSVANVFRGGQVNYRAAGGTGRGQDTIPANLAPEEFVVNPQASRNFFSQLQAINAGSTSASGSNSGGGGNTINVGDINVVSSNLVPSQTAHLMGQELQRQIRRKTFRL